MHLLEGHVPEIAKGEDAFAYREHMRASTERMRESGSYEFRNLQPGLYTIIALAYNNRELEGTGVETDYPRTWQFVELRDGEVLPLDLELVVP